MRIQRLQAVHQADRDSDAVNLDVLDPLIRKYKGKPGSIIPILQGTQEMLGFIPKEAFEKISTETGLKLSDMYGVATFYAQFRLKPVGKYVIKVCHGTACHVQNAHVITEAISETLDVKDGETTTDRLFTLESVACLGCCSLAPVMMIGGNTYGKLTGKEAVNIIKNIRIQSVENVKN
ncbi:MAG: NADH-quinone oxidoreductase subunit NuoE [Bacteroidia bacterium]|nr:NADH-quinone oxidoreductase subunit NuoE [Bacteroidia bacterium]